MKCKNFQELISAFIDNELNLRETLRLKRHIKSCEHCREELKIIGKVQNECQNEGLSWVAPQPSEEFSSTLMNIIHNLPAHQKERNPFFLNKPLFIIRDWFISLMRRPIITFSLSGATLALLIGLMVFSGIQKDKLQTVYELEQKDTTLVAEKDINYYINEYAINASETPDVFREGIIESVTYQPSR